MRPATAIQFNKFIFSLFDLSLITSLNYWWCSVFIFYTTSQKFGHTFSFNGYLHDYLHCKFSVKASKLWMNSWNYVVNKKVWNNSRHVLYFRVFKIATLCFDYCSAHSWHFLDELHEAVTWNGFPTVLKEFSEMLSTCWPFCLHSAVHLIPNHLDWV